MNFNKIRCWTGFATPTEMFEDFNGFQNVSDGVANPVTLRAKADRNAGPANGERRGTGLTDTIKAGRLGV